MPATSRYLNDSAVQGQTWTYGKFDMGPTYGLVRRPLFQDLIITEAGDYTVQPYDFQIIIRKTVPEITTVFLPDITLWMRQPFGMWPLIIKDGSNNAQDFNITVTPFGSQKIDLLDSFVIIENGLCMTLRPLSDLSGWWWS